ncbi:hypothetical protein TNCV_308761 [Trichonephila clavipes]|nr:hypothetical protein TNCV_308761 [Trichonephila clavipes]
MYYVCKSKKIPIRSPLEKKKKKIACVPQAYRRGRDRVSFEFHGSLLQELPPVNLEKLQKTIWKILRQKLNFKLHHSQLTQQVTEDHKNNFMTRISCGCGSRVVWASDRGWLCHEFEPSTTKDPPCRAAMRAKSVES